MAVRSLLCLALLASLPPLLGAVPPAATVAAVDGCAAHSDCISCAQIADCGFCADGLSPPAAGDADDAHSSHIGGWIFKQRGLTSADELEGADADAAADAAAAAAAAAQAAQLSRQQPGSEGGARAARHLAREAAAHAVLSAEPRAATAPGGDRAVAAAAADAFLELGAAAGVDSALAARSRRRVHSGRCWNRTQPVALFPACRDYRVDACDCDGAEAALPACAAVVAEIRTPLVLIVAAFGAAAVIVGGILAVHVSFARCGKRY